MKVSQLLSGFSLREIGTKIRLLLAFALAFSLLAFPNPGSSPTLLGLHSARGATAPNVPWVPAGPAMDTLTHPIFTDESAEFTALQASPSPIDFTDWPLDLFLSSSLTTNPNFQVTSPIMDTGYFELEFHLGQNFWGCQFNYGNAACGTHIRQAFAHAVDKNVFVSQELQGAAVPIDNPVPPSVDLNTPDPCAWDSLFPQTGTGCQVNGVGGTAYHLAAALPGNCATHPQFTYFAGCGQPDFCAAADHLVAAGLATGKDATTCVLTGVAAAVTANPIHTFVRSNNTPRLHLGDGYVQFICALFTGAFTTGCGLGGSTNNVFISDSSPNGSFPGFYTSKTSVGLTWWVYTAGFGNVLTFDKSLFFTYDSQFVSGISLIKQSSGGFCSNQSVPTYVASDYMYICNPSYDTNIQNAEYAPCSTASSDPTTGQTHLTVTFANCPGTSQPSAASAAYKAQDIFGQNAYTIPWYSGKSQFAYLTGWQGGVVHRGNGFTPLGNFFLSLNAWNPTPPVSGTVRQGYTQGTGFGAANPFIGMQNDMWGASIQAGIWDTPGKGNPDSPQAYMDWMTVKTDQLAVGSLSYTAPPGTVAAFRYTLRNDINWQTGQKLTAWDLAFSYIALAASGVGPGLAPMTGIKVLSPTQVDVDVNAVGPFTKLFLSNTVLPGRDWVNLSICTSSAWDAAANNPNFNTANTALTACIATVGSVTASGVITPAAGNSNIDPTKITTNYDPVTSRNLIGSGAWQCGSGSGIGGSSCSSTGTQAVPNGQSWTLTRYGVGTVDGGSLNTYFRSSGNLALWAWSQDRGVFSNDFLNFGAVSLCFGKPVGASGCTVWQHGIGGSATGTVVGLTQVGIVQRFVGVNWVAPYDWGTAPPQNIATFPPVLHEGTITLNPCSADPANGYDC